MGCSERELKSWKHDAKTFSWIKFTWGSGSLKFMMWKTGLQEGNSHWLPGWLRRAIPLQKIPSNHHTTRLLNNFDSRSSQAHEGIHGVSCGGPGVGLDDLCHDLLPFQLRIFHYSFQPWFSNIKAQRWAHITFLGEGKKESFDIGSSSVPKVNNIVMRKAQTSKSPDPNQLC